VKDSRSIASRLKDRVRIERPVTDDAFDGAGAGTWEPLQTDIVSAEIMDMLPSRGERLADGINVTTGPARVRLRYRTDVDSSMRLVEILSDEDGNDVDGRIMQITTRPARLRDRGRELIEFMTEHYSTAGNPA